MLSRSKLLIALAVVAGLGCAGALGLAASIAGPAFLKARPRARQAELAHTLKLLLTQAQEFHRVEGRWATSPRQLVEYSPSAPQRCTCFLGPEGRWGGWGSKVEVKFSQLPAPVRERLSANGPAAAQFELACAINLDDDDALEVWMISSSDPVPRVAFADLGE